MSNNEFRVVVILTLLTAAMSIGLIARVIIANF